MTARELYENETGKSSHRYVHAYDGSPMGGHTEEFIKWLQMKVEGSILSMDHYSEEIASAVDGVIGADRMKLGLPIIPDPRRGDMDRVAELVSVMQSVRKIASEQLAKIALIK